MNAPLPAAALSLRGGADLPAPQGKEPSSSSLVEMARVQTEAAYLMAMRYPRDWATVEHRLLEACSRPTFANSKRTYYIKPVGDNAHGLGIGFVEEAIRAMRNISIDKIAAYDCAEFEVYRVIVTDLESNIPYRDDVKVYKTVERSRPMDNGTPEGYFISRRKNSSDRWTYLVPTANEDDLLNKRAAQVSKAIRQCGLRLLPDYIKEACIERIYAVRRGETSKDPETVRRALIVDFKAVDVQPADLVHFVGKPLEDCTPDELVKLRGMYDAIATGESTWAEFVEGREQAREDAARAASAGAGGTQQRGGRIERPQARPAAANDAPAGAGQQQGQSAPPQDRTPPAQASTQGAQATQTSAPAREAAAPATPASPPASEGQRRFLLTKFAGHAQQLAQALQSVGFHKLVDTPRARFIQIVDTKDAAALAGLTEAQVAAIRANYMPA